MRFAAKTGGFWFLYGLVKAGLDDARGEADIFNSVTTGITMGAIFSNISKLLLEEKKNEIMLMMTISDISPAPPFFFNS